MSRELTQEQEEAIRLERKPTALTAGAGSGKTMVLVERYLSALQRGAKPYQLLTVTFTNEAAAQLRRRISKELRARFNPSVELLDQIETTPYIGTIHSFCYRVLDQYGTQLGLPVIEKILTGQEWSEAFEETYQGWLKETGAANVRALLQHFTRPELKNLARQLFIHRDNFRPWRATMQEPIWKLVNEAYSPFIDKLEALLLSQGYYAFDDLERYALQLLNASDEARQRFVQQFHYLLIDEFQDTSRRQWEILRLLVGDEPQKIFLVGDPKQSIYGFRHADVSLFLDLSERFAADGRSLALTMNFRSESYLLSQINQKSLPLFEGTAIPFQPMRSPETKRADSPCGLTVARFGKDREREVTILSVKALVDQGTSPDTIALLFRNSDRIPLYLEALHAAGIPAQCDRKDRLFLCKEILHLIAYLRTLQDPTDSFHFSSFLRSGFIGMGYDELWKLSESPGDTLWEKGRGLEKLKWLYDWKETEGNVQSALAALFRSTKYWPEQEEAFGALLSGLEEEGMTLGQAVERLNAWEKSDVTFERAVDTTEIPGVRLMTVHGAKGLEFPHVFLVDTCRQPPRAAPPLLFSETAAPGIRFREGDELVESDGYLQLAEKQAKQDKEEAKRILYVALTRAEESLTLLLPEKEVKRPKGCWADLLEPSPEEASGD